MNSDPKTGKEGVITLSLSSFLSENSWEVLACHSPGGHTSFSLLAGRRSRGGIMPDLIAIKFNEKIQDFVVIIAETKITFEESKKDIAKLSALSTTHAEWIAFRLQKNINRSRWLKGWNEKLQRMIAFGQETTSEIHIPPEFIAIHFFPKKSPKIITGKNAPAKDILINKASSDK